MTKCSGYLIGKIVIPNVKFMYRLSGYDKFGIPFAYTKRSLINIPKKPYLLVSVITSSNKTVSTGSKINIYFRLKSPDDATSAISFNITARTSPARLILYYQTTATIKPNDTKLIVISVQAKHTDKLGRYVVTVAASSNDLFLRSYQYITVVKVQLSIYSCIHFCV